MWKLFYKKQKSLSTTHLNAESTAIIAQKANVKKLILTHFWPLENKKEYLKEAKKVFKNTYLAKENKTIKLRRK